MRTVARICTHLDKKVPWDDQPERDDWTTTGAFALTRTPAPVTNTPLFIHRFNRPDQTLSGRKTRLINERFCTQVSRIARSSHRGQYGLILSRGQVDLVYLSQETTKSRETEKNFSINFWWEMKTAVRSSNFYFFPISNVVTSLPTTDAFDRRLSNGKNENPFPSVYSVSDSRTTDSCWSFYLCKTIGLMMSFIECAGVVFFLHYFLLLYKRESTYNWMFVFFLTLGEFYCATLHMKFTNKRSNRCQLFVWLSSSLSPPPRSLQSLLYIKHLLVISSSF